MVANPFWSVITELYHYIAFYLERHRRRVADAWCKRTLRRVLLPTFVNGLDIRAHARRFSVVHHQHPVDQL